MGCAQESQSDFLWDARRNRYPTRAAGIPTFKKNGPLPNSPHSPFPHQNFPPPPPPCSRVDSTIQKNESSHAIQEGLRNRRAPQRDPPAVHIDVDHYPMPEHHIAIMNGGLSDEWNELLSDFSLLDESSIDLTNSPLLQGLEGVQSHLQKDVNKITSVNRLYEEVYPKSDWVLDKMRELRWTKIEIDRAAFVKEFFDINIQSEELGSKEIDASFESRIVRKTYAEVSCTRAGIPHAYGELTRFEYRINHNFGALKQGMRIMAVDNVPMTLQDHSFDIAMALGLRNERWRNLKSKSKFRSYLGREGVCETKNES